MSYREKLEACLHEHKLADAIEKARTQRAKYGDLPERDMELENALCSLVDGCFRDSLEDVREGNFHALKEGLIELRTVCRLYIAKATPEPGPSDPRCSLRQTYNHAFITHI